jgi:hypothetical protein
MLKTKVLMGTVLAVWLAALPAAAQTPDASKLGPVTSRPDRTTADAATRKQMQEKREALRKKRNECIKLRREQKVPLKQRSAFINECVKK